MRRLFDGVLVSAVAVVLVAAAVPHATVARAAAVRAFAHERLWSPSDDWEPNVAVAPNSPWVYEMTTRYGGPSACGRIMRHCIVFRSSPDGGRTWNSDTTMCPGTSCRRVVAQNDPVLAVARDGTVFAVWMNGWDVTFAKSDDHGATWSTPIDLRTGTGLSFTDKPWLAISPSGRDVYVAFNSSDSYVAASHDYGATFAPPVKTNTNGRYWFAEGGAVAPDGTVYFAESAETQAAVGPIELDILRSQDGGRTWRTRLVAVSAQQPPCPTPDCPNDFYGAQISVAAAANGALMAVYVASAASAAPMAAFAVTSRDGVHWSKPTRLPSGGSAVGADFPKVSAGPGPAAFTAAWQDDRNGPTAWNTWLTTTRDGGHTWSSVIRLSDASGGAPYKTPLGYGFPYGDYFGLAVSSRGLTYAIWGEGPAYDGPGGTWSSIGR